MSALRSFFVFALVSLLSFVAHAQARDMTALPEMPDSITLTEKDVTSFIKLAEAVEELGIEFDDEAFATQPDIMQSAMANKELQGLIQESGLAEERWAQVGYSLAMAYAAANQTAEEKAEMQAGLAQIEQLKASMPAEQWEMMKDSMAGAFTMLEQFMNQPEGNLSLVKRYNDELKTIFGD